MDICIFRVNFVNKIGKTLQFFPYYLKSGLTAVHNVPGVPILSGKTDYNRECFTHLPYSRSVSYKTTKDLQTANPCFFKAVKEISPRRNVADDCRVHEAEGPSHYRNSRRYRGCLPLRTIPVFHMRRPCPKDGTARHIHQSRCRKALRMSPVYVLRKNRYSYPRAT